MRQMEARLLLQGELHTFGIPARAIPGKDLREKRLFLTSCAQTDLESLVRTGGFSAAQAAGQVLVVPSGYLMVYIALTDIVGLRWAVGGDHRDSGRVCVMVDDALTSFTELQGADMGWVPFAEYLHFD